jgi:two-component system sensor histidine kinase UhpB
MRKPVDAIVTVTHIQSVIEEDKAALARQIHDDLGGFLIASAMDVTILRHRFSGRDQDSQNKFDRLARSLHGAIDMMRRVTEDLHPTLLDNVGLFAALGWHLKHVCHRSPVNCTVDLPTAEPPLRPGIAISLFRAGQEAMIVAENQSDVTQVHFQAAWVDELLSIRVSADGAGTIPTPDTPGYVALACLHQRVQSLGGTVTFDSPPTGGIRLLLDLPLADAMRDGFEQ